ncbi:hypothetical protein BJ165DRAFT_95330 [Panaeolus papilionaceus]|nr:hypothetical protein BJ165DRAFT_95330 [Panaeolus papilionaceus]
MMPNVHTYLSPRNRNFVVRSMHPETMLRSRAFLERSQLLLLLRKFIEEDEHKTPLHKRDLSWLTDCYYSMGLPQAVSSYLRYNQPIREVLRISTEPRHVRHLAHAHIRGVFAQHAEWLLAVQVATASKNAQMLDIPSWIAFCRDAQEDSLSARNSGYPWGIFHSGAEGAQHARFEKLAARLARFGDTKEEWERRLKNSVKRAHKQKKKQKSPSPDPDDVDREPSHPKPTFQFDSDFSEASTEYDSDNSSELDFQITSQIPPFMFESPTLPAGSFDWRCPSPGCSFAIDLLSVPASLLSKLPLQQQQFVISRCWTLKDARIQEILNQLVSGHYEGHLSDLGFSLAQTGSNKWRLQQTSQQSPKTRKIKKEESNRSMALAR